MQGIGGSTATSLRRIRWPAESSPPSRQESSLSRLRPATRSKAREKISNRPPKRWTRNSDRRLTLAFEKFPRRCFHVGLSHQAFADEEAAHAGFGQAQAVCVAVDAAFADQQRALGRQRGKAL